MNAQSEQYKIFKAKDYPFGNHMQIHAGMKMGGEDIDLNLIKLIVSIQADATIKQGNNRIVWKLGKNRKIEKLEELLNALKNILY